MPTTPREIESITASFKNKKSFSFDGISTNLIKASISEIAVPLSEVINLSLQTGIVPEKMKIAKIIPLYKSGDNQSYCNYRPISILPSLSKILEKTVYKRLTDYLNKYDILNTSQYGFRHGHSTSMALLDFVERIHEELDRKEYTIGVFLDLTKAFDTVNHNILLDKLEHYGIRGTPLLWFKDYLTNRKQYVHFQGTNSDMFDITCGVPESTVLGPLLFLIYINDINAASCKLSFTLFADDTNIFNKNSNLQQLIRSTNEELSKLSLWFKANRLSLNITKTKLN